MLAPLPFLRSAVVRSSLAVCLVVTLSPARAAAQAPVDPASYSRLQWRYIGPVGNRVASVAGVVGDPNVYYAGAASGGIWKTTDGGVHWDPIFDEQDVSSIGALAVSRSDPNIVWAGTGEPWIRSHISVGNGVYKSTDAGRTWTRMGLENTGRIGRIAINPTDPNIVYIAAQGHSYGPQPDRGVFRTKDGGRTWEKVLFVNENTGAIDVVMHPSDPNTLMAATWQLEIHTWGRESGGPGSGIYISHDAGTTWTKLQGNGLPTHTLGKIGLAYSYSNPNRVYALIETGDGVPLHGQPTDNGELWRSDDGGTSWKVVSFDRNLGCRQPYYTRTVVSTDNPDELYFLCATFSRSVDGGVTNSAGGRGGAAGGRGGRGGAGGGAARANAGTPFTAPGGDNHDMWIDPTNAARMVVANDAGVQISTTRSRSWLHVQLPIAQIYHVTTDSRIPYYVYGNKQDGPSYRGPSNSRTGGQIQRSEWYNVDGGESGWATPDPVDTNLVWSTASGSGSRGGIVVRFDTRSRTSQNVEVWPQSTGGYPAGEVPYRFVWDAPFHISPNDHNTIYTGSQFVHRSTDGGRSWQIISPDLTRNDKSKQGISGGLTPDNIGVEYGDVIYAIQESRAKPGVIWVGTNDGLVQVTQDAGKTWTNVSSNIPGMPMWGSVRHVEPSRYDAATAYIICDAHQENNRDPWVYRTNDFGKTWKLIVNGIPKSPLSYAHIIREDPVKRGLLYLGTENAIYASWDDGEHWQSLQMNLPHAPVYGMTIEERFNDLVISTYGRGIFILDDISPLQDITPDIAASAVYLFGPRPAYRWDRYNGNVSQSDDPTAGQNPPTGAGINYWLKAPPQSAPTVTILDAAGKTIRTMSGPRQAGLNRVYWDLNNETTKAPRMRTKPMFDAEFTMDPDGGRPAPGISPSTVLMPPGRYTVRLTVDGQTLTQPLEVRKDPNSRVPDQEIASSTNLLLQMQADIANTADVLNTIESVRSQVQTLSQQLATDRANAPVRVQGDSLEQKFIRVEQTIIDPRLTGRGQDEVRYPVKLGGQLNYLANTIAASDWAPTTQQTEVHAVLQKQLKDTRASLEQLMSKDLTAFNALLKLKGLKTIDVVMPPVVF